RDEAGELLFLLARATALQAQADGDPDARADKLREARRLSGLAEACFGADQVPRALWEQRADLAHLLGDAGTAAELAARARQTPLRTARDLYLIAHQQAIHGNFRAALDALQRVTQEDPRSFPAWFVRGNCHYELLQDTGAVGCFNVCVTLRPEFAW